MWPVTGTSVAVGTLIAAYCQTGYQLNFRNVSEKQVFFSVLSIWLIIRAKHGLQLVK